MTEHTLGDPVDDEIADDFDEDAEDIRDAFDAPSVLAVVALVLAVLSFAGFGLMNGSAYVMPVVTNESQTGRLVFALVLGAALALVPVALGWHAASRTLDDDPAWVATLARSAMLIGLASMLLRLVVAVVQASQDNVIGGIRF